MAPRLTPEAREHWQGVLDRLQSERGLALHQEGSDSALTASPPSSDEDEPRTPQIVANGAACSPATAPPGPAGNVRQIGWLVVGLFDGIGGLRYELDLLGVPVAACNGPTL